MALPAGVARSLIAVGMALAIAALAFLEWKRPKGTAFLRGRALAAEMGCAACHSDPAGGAGPWFPAWAADGGRHPEAVLRKIREGAEGMPAYGNWYGDRDLKDVLTYFEALQGFTAGMPPAVARGFAVAEKEGCFSCHGPGGRGGVGNPGSTRGRILGFDDPEAGQWAPTQAEVEEWVYTGTSRRVEEHWLLGPALRRQAIRMPATPPSRLDEQAWSDLFRYLRWMRGPGARP